MGLFGRLWTAVTCALSFTGLSPLERALEPADQIPLRITNRPHHKERPGPIFKPPGGLHDGDGSEFKCDYSRMAGFRQCSTPEDRSCWLTNDKGITWNITKDYEATANGETLMPMGTIRRYNLTVTENWIMADGLNFTDAKVFSDVNGTHYPGPWIQACWGDLIEVNVTNKLPHNGTSIHWHGIRQWFSMHMDGVNGVTQCPIAPDDYFVYRFNATQYGSSWYHSHYSLQYADGLVGPITIHGPSSQPYDEAPELPLLITDWVHDSAFYAMTTGVWSHPSILLNGIGNVNAWDQPVVDPSQIPTPFTLIFDRQPKKPKKYLLRLINTSFDTTFVFTIDNHKMTVVEADFVPIRGYTTTNLLIGIGQRYNIIVEADPNAPGDDFWIRTYIPQDCTNRNSPNPKGSYMLTGILRYNNESTAMPTTQAWPDLDTTCKDEPYSKFDPVVKWMVQPPVNNGGQGEKENILFNSGIPVKNFSLAKFALNPTLMSDWTPMQIDFGAPSFLNLNLSRPWRADEVVIPEDYKATDWIYLTICDDGQTSPHPIHLHGHDFAILHVSNISCNTNPTIPLKLDNPARRDVVLVPSGGFVVIAFKTDNPGNWLMHCHIARHAAEGLGLQILERDADALARWPDPEHSPAVAEATRVCRNWADWQSQCANWYSGCGPPLEDFQDDSGI